MKIAKKCLKGFVLLSAVFVLGACGNNGGNQQSDSQSSSSAEVAKEKPVVFYVTRHGKTMFNTVTRAQGWADTPLTDAGVEVAEALGKGIKKENIEFTAAYSSDLGRARETAELVLDNSGQKKVPLTEDKRLREFCFGIYEGDTDENMWGAVGKKMGYNSYEDFMKAFADRKVDLTEAVKNLKSLDTTGLAEDQPTVKKRMQTALKEIAKKTEADGGGNVLLVAHGMSILAMVSDLTDDELPIQLENASVTKIVYENNQFKVESVGDMSYVEAGEK
jgi:broad specificity phosphatase PhoE